MKISPWLIIIAVFSQKTLLRLFVNVSEGGRDGRVYWHYYNSSEPRQQSIPQATTPVTLASPARYVTPPPSLSPGERSHGQASAELVLFLEQVWRNRRTEQLHGRMTRVKQSDFNLSWNSAQAETETPETRLYTANMFGRFLCHPDMGVLLPSLPGWIHIILSDRLVLHLSNGSFIEIGI